MKKSLLAFILSAIYLFLLSKYVSFFMADIYRTASERYLGSGEYIKAVSSAEKAVENNPDEPSYRRQKAKALLARLVVEEDEAKIVTKDEVYATLQVAEELNAKNLTTLRNIIPLYYFLAVKDIGQPINSENLDEVYLPITAEYYFYLKDRYSNDLGIIVDVAEYERKLMLDQQYSETVEMVKNLRPEILEWHEAFN